MPVIVPEAPAIILMQNQEVQDAFRSLIKALGFESTRGVAELHVTAGSVNIRTYEDTYR